uniref:Uncharacterized protein n=1 Tax=Arundo donax TaxID=35708 RepID=A0A0A9EVZ0_ARUDO
MPGVPLKFVNHRTTAETSMEAHWCLGGNYV